MVATTARAFRSLCALNSIIKTLVYAGLIVAAAGHVMGWRRRLLDVLGFNPAYLMAGAAMVVAAAIQMLWVAWYWRASNNLTSLTGAGDGAKWLGLSLLGMPLVVLVIYFFWLARQMGASPDSIVADIAAKTAGAMNVAVLLAYLLVAPFALNSVHKRSALLFGDDFANNRGGGPFIALFVICALVIQLTTFRQKITEIDRQIVLAMSNWVLWVIAHRVTTWQQQAAGLAPCTSVLGKVLTSEPILYRYRRGIAALFILLGLIFLGAATNSQGGAGVFGRMPR